MRASTSEHLSNFARTYEYQSDFARTYYGQGKAEGKAESKSEDILAVLAARSLSISDEARAQITSCTDLEQLETWIRRAATVDSIDQLFT
jgi:hypothetical protein